jgi:hypothetical protein
MPGRQGTSSTTAPADGTGAAELKHATRALHGAVLEALWRQWAVLGAAASGPRAHAIVDPEALVMASLWFLDDDPRLSDLLASWVVLNAHLLSVQRLRNVAELFPAAARDRVSAVARLALERAKDFRWKPLVRQDVAALAERAGKTLSVAVPLQRAPALMLRLRGLLGVGMRIDVIAFLVSSRREYATADDIATATVYNPTAVRRLLTQLTEAGGLSREDGTRLAYSIKGTWLSRVAGSDKSMLPKWRYAAQVFALATDYLDWSRATRSRVVTPFAAAVKGEELFRRHQQALLQAGVVSWREDIGVEENWSTLVARLAEWVNKVM